jgi:uncharacterized membrane protein YczE
MKDKRLILRGEVALILAIIINSMGVLLMLQSGSGISAISSVPYAFSEVFTRLSLGKINYKDENWNEYEIGFLQFYK